MAERDSSGQPTNLVPGALRGGWGSDDELCQFRSHRGPDAPDRLGVESKTATTYAPGASVPPAARRMRSESRFTSAAFRCAWVALPPN